jgi:hypothetical protein
MPKTSIHDNLPDDLKSSLPTVEEIERELSDFDHELEKNNAHT